MARFVTGETFGTTDTVTATKLNNAVNNAAISTDSVDNNTIEVNSNALRLKDSSSKTTGVTFAKMQHISTAKVLGRSTAGEGDVEEAFDFKDEDDMSSNSATALASQQSIKAYVDSTGIVQTALASTTGEVTTGNSIPADSTIPQIGEGEFTGLSVSMTPTSTTNTIRAAIEGRFISSVAGATIVVALFEGNTCVGVTQYQQPSSGIGATNSTFYFNSASTAAHTYTVRFGTTSGIATFDISPTFGGVRKATLFLEEISV